MARNTIICPRLCAKAHATENDRKRTVLMIRKRRNEKNAAEVISQRNDDDFADEIGGRDPGTVVHAGANAALDVEQRSVGDLDIEHGHEGAEQRTQHRGPVLEACSVGPSGRTGGMIQRGHRSLLGGRA
jgi:hypothetical protein